MKVFVEHEDSIIMDTSVATSKHFPSVAHQGSSITSFDDPGHTGQLVKSLIQSPRVIQIIVLDTGAHLTLGPLIHGFP